MSKKWYKAVRGNGKNPTSEGAAGSVTPQTSDRADATERVKALIEAEVLDPMLKQIYLGALAADPSEFERTGAPETAEGVRRNGASHFIDEQGKLRDIYSLGFTAQTVDILHRSASNRQLAASLTTGGDLFEQVRSNPGSIKDLQALCDVAPLAIKKQYITAVSRVFTEGQKAKKILQRMVNYATGIGDVDDDRREGYSSGYGVWGSLSYKDHRIANGLSYIANALELKPRAEDSRLGRPHPAISILDRFIRSLPKERFEIDPPLTQAQGRRTLDEMLARTLPPDKQRAADELKDILCGKGWREKEQDKGNTRGR